MRDWNLSTGDPLSLILAADIRTSPIDYINDHIWELSIGSGNDQNLAAQTNFGLRAKSLRIFPSFTLGDETRSDVKSFSSKVQIHRIFPNFISLSFSPFTDLDVITEFWVPSSHSIAGRLVLTNNSTKLIKIQIDWVTHLIHAHGERMVPIEHQAVNVLSGKTDGLSPLFFMTGGPKPGSRSYPSLMHSLELAPGKKYQQTWTLASLTQLEDSFNLARKTININWESQKSYLEMLNESQIDIITGNPDWDTAFMLTQKHAISLIVGPTENLPHPSLVLSREVDDGFSFRGDGSDYTHTWNGQSPLETYYLTNLILPIAPKIAEGLLFNFLATQEEQGEIDWKPGLAGQRSKLLATPMLCSLAWRIYETTHELSLIENSFHKLLSFILAWFTAKQDRDGDGIPEWDHPLQTALDDHPTYSPWHSWSQGVEITTTESPALCAFLYRECQILIQMAELLKEEEAIISLQNIKERLKDFVDLSWKSEEMSYFDWDRDTHLTGIRAKIVEFDGPGIVAIEDHFIQPVRLQVHIQLEDETIRKPHIFIHGMSLSGNNRVEHLSDKAFRWQLGRGVSTSQYAYSSVSKIEIQNTLPGDKINISSVGLDQHDISTLLPLWAGIPGEETASQMVKGSITNPEKYWQNYGLPVSLSEQGASENDICRMVSIPWNVLIGEGLLMYGYREVAARLVERIMTGVVTILKKEGAFRGGHHAITGKGSGERNQLVGLAPLSLFLETLGIRLISPQEIILTGFNPFNWPVTVKYRGTTILRQRDKSTVIFPDGQTVLVDDPSPQIISLDIG